MTMEALLDRLKEELVKIVRESKLLDTELQITSKALSPEDAIGITMKKDFPILKGKEIMLQATFGDGEGQSFTSSPAIFCGTIKDVLEMDIYTDEYARSIFIAALNAVMKHIKKTSNTVHCKNDEPEICAKKYVEYIKENYNNPKIALIGYQPAMLEQLSKEFDLRVLDLNPDNVGQTRYGVMVEDGIKDFDFVVKEWSTLVLCTGSTICNGSIVDFLNLEKEVVFFGTTLAGAASILGLKRVCFCST